MGTIGKNITGQKFGRLTVMYYIGKKNKHHRWACACICGNQTIVNAHSLIYGGSKSCGCLRVDKARERMKTIAYDYPKEHAVWKTMRQRCKNKNNDDFMHYGGRGIKVYKKWDLPKIGFANFINDMGPRPSNKHTLDRKDNNGDYCPNNCQWATRREQSINTRQNKWVTHNGITKCISDWIKELTISKYTVYNRIRKGWTLEKALFTPVDPCKKIGGYASAASRWKFSKHSIP